jgi:RnfABCDGE-type electron transport complex B subunit
MGQIQIAILVLGSTGFCFAVLLAFLSKKLKVEEDPRVVRVLEVLPGLNCGACGFSGCRPFADAVVKECQLFNGCLPGGEEINNKILEILGVAGCVPTKNQTVVCHCGAEGDEKKIFSLYQGPKTCRAAHVTGGAIDCSWGCIGFGDCVKICPVGALSLVNGKIYVDINKCTACGQCVKICPRNLFKIVPFKKGVNLYSVACSNKEKALAVKKVCDRGCIGCGICARVADSPYYLKDNLSYIDYSKALTKGSLQEGKAKCPTKCIFSETTT